MKVSSAYVRSFYKITVSRHGLVQVLLCETRFFKLVHQHPWDRHHQRSTVHHNWLHIINSRCILRFILCINYSTNNESSAVAEVAAQWCTS